MLSTLCVSLTRSASGIPLYPLQLCSRSLAFSNRVPLPDVCVQMSDVEMNYDGDLDFSFDGFFEDEPAVVEEALATAGLLSLVLVLALRGLARAKAKAKPRKVRSTRVGVLAKLQRKLAARRAVAADAADAAEQAANIAGSDDLDLDAEQVEPDPVESNVDADADADPNERVGLDRGAFLHVLLPAVDMLMLLLLLCCVQMV